MTNTPIKIKFNGKTYSKRGLAKYLGCDHTTIRDWLKHGTDIEMAGRRYVRKKYGQKKGQSHG